MIAIAVMLYIVACVLPSHCATSSHSHNSYGAVIYQENPNQYLEGAITHADLHKEGKRDFTTIRVQPTNTYNLFTEDITFCGNQAEMFRGMTGDIVITFSKVMHQTWCFELYSVHQVKEKKLQ
jgi:hypothetical protein